VWDAINAPSRRIRLEQAHHKPTSFWSDVGVPCRILDHWPVWVDFGHFVRHDIIVFCRLEERRRRRRKGTKVEVEGGGTWEDVPLLLTEHVSDKTCTSRCVNVYE
jgi:hypothetical protein